MKQQMQIWFVGTLVLAGLTVGVVPLAQAASGPNMILFIGDGMGFEHVQAGRLYRNGNDSTPLTFETLPYQGQAVTKLPDGTITDSATAGTALATGYQHPVNGIISMGADNSIKTSILELAKARGLRTGIITTDSISGATPAAFGAHEPNRSYEADIRYDYLMDDTTYPHPASQPNVLFGGGFDDPFLIPGANATYVAVATLLDYSFVSTASALDLLAPTDYALGLFCNSWAPMDAFVANNTSQPRLPQMVNKALPLLQDNDGAGFFLMVEGALIDKLSHSNDPDFTPEVAQLDLAVEEAFTWATQTGQNLLVIVTADHETGGLNVPDGQVITPGTIPALTFSSTGHTGANVPVYGNWPAGLHGQTIDNTEVFFIMEDYLEAGKAPQLTGLSVSGISETAATVQWNTTELSDSRAALSGIAEPFLDSVRVVAHTLFCTGLQPGTTYTLTASSTDLAGYTGTATTEFTTQRINLPPLAEDQIVWTDEDAALSVTLAGSDPDNDPLIFSIVTPPEHGSLTGTAPNLVYAPDPDYSGPDTFTFKVNDTKLDSAPATVTINIVPVQDPPTPPQNLAAIPGPAEVKLSWTASTDPDGDTLTYEVYRRLGGDYVSPIASVTQTSYTDSDVVNGTTYYYVVRAKDPGERYADSVEISATPSATAYDAYVAAEPSVTIGVVTGGDYLATKLAADGAVQTLTETVRPNNTASLDVSYPLHTTASQAEVTGLSLHFVLTSTAWDDPFQMFLWDGTAWETIPPAAIQAGSYTPVGSAQNYVSAQGEIRVRFTDGKATKKEPADSVNVDLLYAEIASGPPTANRDPVAVNDSGGTSLDTSVSIAVLANDSDPDGDSLVVTAVSTPTSGTGAAFIEAGGATVLYTPGTGFTGSDTFTYTVSDGRGGSATATVSVTVGSTPNAVFVQSILMSLTAAGKNWKATAAVLVHNQDGQPAPGSTVYGNWSFRGTLIQTGALAATDASGVATLTSPPAKANAGDIFTFQVTDIVLDGHVYRPDLNGTIEGSISR